MTPHIESKKEDIAKKVLMPGDPLRAKYIAENFLTDVKLVNEVRNEYAYTGYYNGERVTIFSSGMGIPSMGIYSYELFKFYEVDTIIRIGSCGGYTKELDLLDVILVEESITDSSYAKSVSGKKKSRESADTSLNEQILKTARQENIPIKKGNVYCSEVFDYYIDDLDAHVDNMRKEYLIAAEMEAFALFFNAKKFKKKAACLLSVVDSHFHKAMLTSVQREKTLNDMIHVALETITNK